MSKEAERLLTLARELRLTEKQRRFAEALALDPNRNQTKAAIAAGVPERTAHVQGAKMVRVGKVQAYLKAFLCVAPDDVVKAKAPRIADRNEVLRRLTRQARADIGRHLQIDAHGVPQIVLDPKYTGILRGVKVKAGPTNPETQRAMWTETEIRVADPVVPLQALARIYGMEKEPGVPGNRTLVVNLLGALPPQRLRELTDDLLTGGNGNGHRPD